MDIQSFHTTVCKEFEKLKTENKRDEIEFLKTVIWFAEVKRRLKLPTAYKVAEKLEPKVFGRNSAGKLYHSSLYTKYSLGRHTPNQRRVEIADHVCTGTKGLIQHVLWEVLATDEKIPGHAKTWLRTLSPDIQTILFKINTGSLSSEYQRKKLGLRELKALKRRPSIDSLAAFTILIKEAHSTGSLEDILLYGRFLYSILLILCTQSLSDFLIPLIDIYERRVFSLISHEGLRLNINFRDFEINVLKLGVLTANIEESFNKKVTSTFRTKIMDGILEGRYGYDVKATFDPAFIIDNRVEDKSQINYQRLKAHNYYHSLMAEKLVAITREVSD